MNQEQNEIQTQFCCFQNPLSEPLCCAQIFAAGVSRDIETFGVNWPLTCSSRMTSTLAWGLGVGEGQPLPGSVSENAPGFPVSLNLLFHLVFSLIQPPAPLVFFLPQFTLCWTLPAYPHFPQRAQSGVHFLWPTLLSVRSPVRKEGDSTVQAHWEVSTRHRCANPAPSCPGGFCTGLIHPWP